MATDWIVHCDDVKRASDLIDDPVDAVLCDPPYGLGDPSYGDDLADVLRSWLDGGDEAASDSGFMGRDWDQVQPPAAWQAIRKVAKPGAWMASFGGTRTFDLQGVAQRLGGWVPRDQLRCLMWAYGCLSEDSEILTEDGWCTYDEIDEGDVVASWDAGTESIELQQVQGVNIKPYTGQMVRIQNDNTDQLLTPNHRVYRKSQRREQVDGDRGRWFDEEWNVVRAGKMKKWRTHNFPLAGYHDGEGIGGEAFAELLGWVWTEGHFHKDGAVWVYQSDVNQGDVDRIDDCLDRLDIEHGRYGRDRDYNGDTYVENSWRINNEIASKIRELLPGKKFRWNLLWSMSQSEKRAFHNAAMRGDGSDMTFYQKDPKCREVFQALLHCIGMQGRHNEDKDAVASHDNPTTQMQARHWDNCEVDYDGIVWCVTVPNKAFVARRNGKVFITGNSGFPKSQDVSKAIDDAKGAEREVVGKNPHRREGREQTHTYERGNDTVASKHITVPATDEAERWDGWGTALAPAHEPIGLWRNPTDKTFAECATEEGCGAIHIDGCRVGVSGGTRATNFTDENYGDMYGNGNGKPHNDMKQIDKGRWPSNFALCHHPACSDECVPQCHTERLDAQSGYSKSRGETTRGAGGQHQTYGEFDGQGRVSCPQDEGGASRFFPRFRYCPKASRAEREAGLFDPLDGRTNQHVAVKPIKLCEWLATLLLPPERDTPRRIAVPYSGSGSEMIGAMLAGWDEVIGIERDADHCEVARRRMSWWQEHGHDAIEAHKAEVDRREQERQTGQTCMFGDDFSD